MRKGIFLGIFLFILTGCTYEIFYLQNQDWDFQLGLEKNYEIESLTVLDEDGFWLYKEVDCEVDCSHAIVSYETFSELESFEDYSTFMEETFLENLLVGNNFQILENEEIEVLKDKYKDRFDLDAIEIKGQKFLKHERNFAPEDINTYVLYWWEKDKKRAWSVTGDFDSGEFGFLLANFDFL